jgi:hypothetical protein
MFFIQGAPLPGQQTKEKTWKCVPQRKINIIINLSTIAQQKVTQEQGL